MPLFQYTARNAQGKTLTGTLEANNEAIAARMLRERGEIPVSIQMGSASSKTASRKNRGKGGRVKLDDLVVFSRMLAVMIRAGLPLVEVINILGEQADKRKLREVLRQVERNIEEGSSFTESLQKHPRVFNDFFVSMVKAGEASGMLDTILDLVATYLEKIASINRKIRAAVMYPAVVGTLALGITFFLVWKIVPKFKEIFDDLGGQLPIMTKITVGASEAIEAHWPKMFIGLALVIVFLWRFKNTYRGRRVYDRVKLKMPVFGPLFLKVGVSRFSRTLSVLIRAGVNILAALEIVAKTSGNSLIEDAVLKTKTSIQSGETLARPLVESGIFPPMVTRMVDVGERTGALENMLSKIADFYEDQVDSTVSMLMSLIEPLLIVFLGVMVGFIVISMFLPLFKMLEHIG